MAKLSYLKETCNGHCFLLGVKPKTHIKDVSGFFPSGWSDREARHITNEHPLELEDLSHQWKKQEQYVPEVNTSTWERRRCFCVDVYTHGT